MASKIFNSLIEQKIVSFKETFVERSIELFDLDGKLYHPGEFGAYREKQLSELLRCVTPNNYDISNGFIITADDRVSTQCDLLVVSRDSITLFDHNFKFYPAETVAGIIEVKSDLTYKQLESAMRKMAYNKMLFSSRYANTNTFFADEAIPFSYLVCKKIKCDIQNKVIDNLELIYDGIPREYWHNAILSIDDGLISYSLTGSQLKTLKNNINPYASGGWYASEIIIRSIKFHESSQALFEPSNVINPNEMIKNFVAMYAVYLPRISTEKIKILKYLDQDAEIFA
ncbi:MAG TPA: DUF6602 domain-containing protein [Mobilitalea sp.]|nr:DUF6602 domain-containing protein [Mobilitalea sp.]